MPVSNKPKIMKNHILSVLLVLIAVVSFAQKGFHIGVSGTFSTTFIYTQNNYGTLAPFAIAVVRGSEMNYRLTIGGRTGIVAGYNFNHNWGLQAELQYLSTGQKYEDNFTGPATIPGYTFGAGGGRVNVKREIRLSYIRVPIMAKFISNGGHTAKFYGALGPELGIRIGAKEEVKIADHIYLPDNLAFSSSEKFQAVDIGIALQLGTEVYVTDHLYLDIGFSSVIGVFDINGKKLKTLEWYSKNDVKYQKSFISNVGLVAGIHYIIGKGKGRDYH